MRLDVLTIFPQMFRGVFSAGMVRQAIDRELAELRVWDLRDFCEDRHRTTDDYAYGGGPGMVLKPEPIFHAVDEVRQPGARVILLTPQGRQFSQRFAGELARQEQLVFICGRYEGVDDRVRQALVTDELSIGDYVLTGGELPAMVVIDAVVRLLPGLLKSEVPADDSFASGLLEGPQYTRPPEFRGLGVPHVLTSGHHERIAQWRREQALRITLERRPELLDNAPLTDTDRRFVERLRERLTEENEVDP